MIREIKPNIHAVGVIDYDARLFDRLIPLPDGTSYNSYLIKGSEKTALLDTSDFSICKNSLEQNNKIHHLGLRYWPN